MMWQGNENLKVLNMINYDGVMWGSTTLGCGFKSYEDEFLIKIDILHLKVCFYLFLIIGLVVYIVASKSNICENLDSSPSVTLHFS